MKRLISIIVQTLLRGAAARAYRHASRRTSKLYAEKAAVNAELQTALKAEAAAAERMEKAFNPTT